MASRLTVTLLGVVAGVFAKSATIPKEQLACTSYDSCMAVVQQLANSMQSPLISEIGRRLLDARRDEVWEHPDLLSFGSIDSQWCPNNSYYELLPVHRANLTQSMKKVAWPGDGCFNSMQASVVYNATGAAVTLTGSNPTTLLCSDLYMVFTSFSLTLVEVSSLSPNETAFIGPYAAGEAQDVQLNGVKIAVGPCGVLGSISSLVATLSLFVAANDTDLSENNYKFLTARGVWPNPTPLFGKTQAIDKSLVRSGDYIAVARLDGLDPMIMWGIGSITGHSAIAVWEGNTLYVSESTDANPFGKVYWPPPYGIIRHDWDTWLALAAQAEYHVSVLPIAPQYADVFNETAYWNWYYTVQGMAYGYHTMLFSFLDTADPLLNLPQPIDNDIITVLLNFVDQFTGNGTDGVTVYSMLTWGFNKRLNTTCQTLACVLQAINAQKSTGSPIDSLASVAAMPEQDIWMYGKNYSMVCSEFAAHGWKQGLKGAFPVWNNIQSNEQTPKDNYMTNIFDTSRFNSSNCPVGLTTSPTGNGPYCQLMGQYQMVLKDYNTVPIYAHMNDACPAQWPTYYRCPAGQPTCC